MFSPFRTAVGIETHTVNGLSGGFYTESHLKARAHHREKACEQMPGTEEYRAMFMIKEKTLRSKK